MDRGGSDAVQGIGRDNGRLSWLEMKGEIVESMPMEWTDEKHNLYLNSMEASFLDQLYSHEFNANHILGWPTRIQNDEHLSQPLTAKYSGQFKVLNGGCWSDIKFERSRGCEDVFCEARDLHRSPWIQHFSSNSNCDVVESRGKTGISCMSQQELDTVRKNQGEDTLDESESTNMMPSFCPHACSEDSLRNCTEVSDQNFVDDINRAKQASCVCKKRNRSTTSDRNNEVSQLGTLSGVFSSDEDSQSHKQNYSSDCSSTKNPRIRWDIHHH
ncbi:cold-regulated protein 27-like isoform X2 [Wolffia australiana]